MSDEDDNDDNNMNFSEVTTTTLEKFSNEFDICVLKLLYIQSYTDMS